MAWRLGVAARGAQQKRGRRSAPFHCGEPGDQASAFSPLSFDLPLLGSAAGLALASSSSASSLLDARPAVCSAGDREQLEGKIQERYGIEKAEARRQTDEWLNRQTY